MSQNRSLRPDSLNTAQSWDRENASDAEGSPPPSATTRNDLRSVARKLAALGSGAVAFDLALDLVLNEVVEQARSTTQATGAAIAMNRDGEMVCRATTGAAAPDLGMRVETASGLSGACLNSGEIQHCSDTETDVRVDAEACRQLGVRSMVVMPLSDEQTPFGILEVLSSRPNAFGRRDIEILQGLAKRIVASKREAEEGRLDPPEVVADAPVMTESRGSTVPAQGLAASGISPADARAFQRSDAWSTILVVLVVATAILLGVMIGWRGAAKRWILSARKNGSTPATIVRENTVSAAAPPPAASFGASSASAAAQTRAISTKPSDAQSGGLVVTDNGKVIYRVPPSAAPTSPTSKHSPNGTAGTRLIHRVDPDYPAQAKARRIQGAVVLDIQVAGDGSIGNIAIVSGDPVLAEAAVHAVRQWRYQPYSVDGHAVESETRITFKFSLPSND